MLVVQARFRYTQNPCVGFLLVAGWCFQHFVRNPAQVNTRSTSLTINVRCWPQTWQRALRCGVLDGIARGCRVLCPCAPCAMAAFDAWCGTLLHPFSPNTTIEEAVL